MTLRLVTLWEIMNLFDVEVLAYVLHWLAQAESGMILQQLGGRGAQKPTEISAKKARDAIAYAEIFCRKHQLEDCLNAVIISKERWERPTPGRFRCL